MIKLINCSLTLSLSISFFIIIDIWFICSILWLPKIDKVDCSNCFIWLKKRLTTHNYNYIFTCHWRIDYFIGLLLYWTEEFLFKYTHSFYRQHHKIIRYKRRAIFELQFGQKISISLTHFGCVCFNEM